MAQAREDIQRLRAIGAGSLGSLRDIESNEDVQVLLSTVNDLLASLAEASGRKPVLLADGLDRKPKVAVLQALADWGVLKGLAAPLVLTGPPDLLFAHEFNGLRGPFRTDVVYNLPVRQRAESGICQTGISVLLTITRKRLDDRDLSTEFIADGVMERAAQLSSGLVREHLDLLHGAAMHAWKDGSRTIEAAHLDRAIRDRRMELQLALTTAHIGVLREVLETGRVPLVPIAQDMLHDNYLACYPNGSVWFQPHELLVEFIRDEAERLAQSRV